MDSSKEVAPNQINGIHLMVIHYGDFHYKIVDCGRLSFTCTQAISSNPLNRITREEEDTPWNNSLLAFYHEPNKQQQKKERIVKRMSNWHGTSFLIYDW